MVNNTNILPGKSYPLGATVLGSSVNFCVYSKNSTAMDLLLFDHADASKPSRIIPFNPKINRTFYYWHMEVPNLVPGQIYGYRAYGPFQPQRGHRFDSAKVLLDPYGRGMSIPANYERQAAARPGDNTSTALKSVIVDLGGYDWEGDAPLKRPRSQTIIYEMHVGGFTKHPSSGVEPEYRGTYAGLIQKIPYLKDLGVTAVELLPVFQFDEQSAPLGLKNYWGYDPVSFFTPHSGYSSIKDPTGVLVEFRDMVKALHKQGIEVILDVVYNHTAEAGQAGPTFCFRGLENSTYYILEADKSRYANFSGTGNTFSANHSVVRRLILDSLRFWVMEMHVDGFRFDLATILTRDESGVPLANPPIIWSIESDPVLAGAKLIAEAWDAAGLYQVGNFTGEHWLEWNGKFRDDMRGFFKGDAGLVRNVSSRFFASPDLYEHENREPEQSINFITCHDGFTLNDLVSYNQKHNYENGEGNRDGSDHNLSWNFGVEGPTDDPEIEMLRNRQVKNFLSVTLLSLGIPMLLMGDEMRRTQSGNNNAYCQDNEISWMNWQLLEKHDDIHRFVKRLIQFRQSLDVFKVDHNLSLSQLLQLAQIEWHGTKIRQPDYGYNSHCLAFSIKSRRERFYVIFNAFQNELEFEIPALPENFGSGWRRIIDTSCISPGDFCDWDSASVITELFYMAQPLSVVVLSVEIGLNSK